MTDATTAPTEVELDVVLDGLRRLIETEVVPRHRALDGGSDRKRIYAPDGRFTPEVIAMIREVRQVSAAAGFYTMLAPVSVGGAGLGYEALFRVWEEVYRSCGSEHWLGYSTVAHWSRGPSHLLESFSPRARAEIEPGLLRGDTSLCFAMSEPDAGSDIWNMRTRAERSSAGWVLTGTKQWITNAPYADYALVFAVTDRTAFTARAGGLTAFVVPTTAPGLRIDRVIEMFGHPGGDEGIVSFHDVEVADDDVVGEVGDGVAVAMSGVSAGRVYNAARSVGLGRWALDKAMAYAGDRTTFGRSIIENQGVSFPLAEAAMELHAARLVGIDAARRRDAGHDARLAISIAKAFATETAVRVIDSAVQVHGAMGFTNEVGLAEAWQQVRRICVADGSAEMMRRQVVKHLRSGERPWDPQ